MKHLYRLGSFSRMSEARLAWGARLQNGSRDKNEKGNKMKRFFTFTILLGFLLSFTGTTYSAQIQKGKHNAQGVSRGHHGPDKLNTKSELSFSVKKAYSVNGFKPNKVNPKPLSVSILDPTFNTTGTVRAFISGGNSSDDKAHSVAIQSDGKMVVAGYSEDNSGNYAFAVARYNAAGSLDSTFGTNGSTRTFISGGNSNDDEAYSLAIQSDGKIVVAGYSCDGSHDAFAVARYDATGSLDSTFGTNGSTRTFISGGNSTYDLAYSVAIQSDGKIVAAGYSYDGSGYAFAVARYNATGSLDPTFNTTGTVRTFISGGNSDDDEAHSVAIQSDGKIVAAGYSYDGSGGAFAVVRYNTNGSLDNTFGTNGSTRTFISGGNSNDDEAYSLAIQSDGKIVAAGYSYDGSGYAFAVARYNADGSRDSTLFGSNGSTRSFISGGNSTYDLAYSVAIQSDGKIVAAGYCYDGSAYAFAVARYLSENPAYAETALATGISTSAATLQGTVYPKDVNTTVRFLYGTSSGVYTDSVAASPSTVNGTAKTSVSAALSGLAAGTTYYYRVSGASSTPVNYFASDEMNFGTFTTGNNALKFDGVDDYVDIPNNSALNPATFTYEFWARVDGGSGSYRAPLSSRYWDYTYMYGAHFYAQDNNMWALWWGSGAASTQWATLQGDSVIIGQWTHLAATYDGTTMRFYINGVLQGDSVCAFGVNTVTPLRFGAVADGLALFFNGELDEVRVWNVVRSQAEIQSTMNTTLTGAETGLVGYWQFNEAGTTTSAEDHLGLYSGTLHNFSFDGLSDGWVANSDLPLPVEATDFVAKSDIGSVTLSWKTGSEIDNAGFNVLRQDPGMTSFSLISSYSSNAALKGLGTSTSGRSYNFTDSKVKSGATYSYKVQSVGTEGTTKDVSTLTGITVGVPKTYALYQNYPNPFNPTTTIRFDLKQQSTVTMEIYNVLGQRVSSKDYGTMDAGRYNESVDMGGVASGVYYYRIVARGTNGEKFTAIKKLMLMK